MRSSALLFALLVLASGCNASITRTGYSAPSRAVQAHAVAPEQGTPACDVLITGDERAASIALDEAARDEPPVLIGSVSYSDSGFSIRCDEARALRLFRADACAVGADLVVISNERSPDAWSTCYRATATLYDVAETIDLGAIGDRRSPEQLVNNRGDGSGTLLLYMTGALAASTLISALVASSVN